LIEFPPSCGAKSASHFRQAAASFILDAAVEISKREEKPRMDTDQPNAACATTAVMGRQDAGSPSSCARSALSKRPSPLQIFRCGLSKNRRAAINTIRVFKFLIIHLVRPVAAFALCLSGNFFVRTTGHYRGGKPSGDFGEMAYWGAPGSALTASFVLKQDTVLAATSVLRTVNRRLGRDSRVFQAVMFGIMGAKTSFSSHDKP